MKSKTRIFRAGSALASLAATLLAIVACSSGPTLATTAAARRFESQQAFVQIATVLRHPRCLNCHPATDYPRQGDEGRRHAMLVQRGPDNHGVTTLRCNTCHQSANQDDRIPGAPHWGLAPISMAWDGLDDHDLAEALKDKSKNGGRSLEDLYEHMARDPLVAWAWNPGGNRRAPPLSHGEFGRIVRRWIDTGAASPDKVPATSTSDREPAR